MKATSIIPFLFFQIVFSNAFGQLTGRQVADRAFKSTVLISTIDSDGQSLAIGSGFVIGSGVIATNFHVIENSNGGFVRFIGSNTKYKIKGIIEKSEKYDLAIISVDQFSAPQLNFGDYSKVGVGDEIYAIGNPNGLEGTFSQGIVSGLRDVSSDELLQITAPISPGSSGGPVMNSNAEIIGIAVASYKSGQNLNFAIPIKYLDELYSKSSKNVKSFFETKKSSYQGSLISSFGETLDSGVEATSFNWSSNQFTGQYTFSIRNKLDRSIKNVLCLVIFYDENKLPIDTEYVNIEDYIAPKLAIRTTRLGRISADIVRDFTHHIELRVVHFKFAD